MSGTAPIPFDLGDFEGEAILGIAVKITKAGDGLSNALKVDPRRIGKGERVKLLLEVEGAGVFHRPAKDSAGWIEERTLEAIGITFIPVGLQAEAERLLSVQADAIKKAAEEARGINRLPIGDALVTAHETGDHAAGLVPGCPTCQAEADAVALEAEEELAAMGGPAVAPAGDDFGDPEPPPATSSAGTAKAGASVSTLAGRRTGRAGKAAAEA